MAAVTPEQVTGLLQAWSEGDPRAFDKLAPLVYNELRRLARRHKAHERPEHSLQTTELVHEAYLRIADFRRLKWKNRLHFFAISSQVMRRVLVDAARTRGYQKRGGGHIKLSLEECMNLGRRDDRSLVALDDALTALASEDPRKCQVVEMKFFGGLTTEEIAIALGVAPETVSRDWRLAKLWLLRELRAKEKQ